jgi:hypothetical protein
MAGNTLTNTNALTNTIKRRLNTITIKGLQPGGRHK